MPIVKSSDVISAIIAAQNDNEIQEELNKRDHDNRLDCVQIKCEVTSGVDSPVKRFRLIFNYGFVNNHDSPGEDIVVEIEKTRDSVRVINWRSQ